jgi:carboxyl-terminal processing protease
VSKFVNLPDKVTVNMKKNKWCLYLPLVALLFLTGITPARLHAQQAANTDQYFEISKNLEIFSNLFKELNQLYVDPLQPGKMVKTGVDAMLSDLDPYTNFITEADIESYKFQTTGRYGGIGAATRIVDSEMVIADPYQNGPAVKAGIKAGDIIISINGQPVKDKDPDDLGLLMRGAPGTSLEMMLRNPLTGKESSRTIVREEIQISSVPYAGLMGKNKDIAYVYLSQFMQNSSRDVRHALDSLNTIQPELKGVVLDLRGNPGGLLGEAVNICNLFIAQGQTVVTTKGKNPEWTKTFRTSDPPWNLKIPLAVLVNHHSASASEIVAGTMQDLDRGIIIGTQSFGKGLVQEVRPLGYNTRLKVTVAHYYTPSGRCIQALDYAHRNEDGSVSAVPDSLKKTFSTKAGRKVQDGGGIAPDVPVEEEEYSNIALSLLVKNYIFNYATKYYYSHPSIAPAEQFSLSEPEFSDFKNWLNTQNFAYRTEGEKMLEVLKKDAQENKYFDRIKSEYNALVSKIANDKFQELEKNKSEIIALLSNEIVSRYYYQSGRVLQRLSLEDKTLDKALILLPDSVDYTNLLK